MSVGAERVLSTGVLPSAPTLTGDTRAATLTDQENQTMSHDLVELERRRYVFDQIGTVRAHCRCGWRSKWSTEDRYAERHHGYHVLACGPEGA